MPSSEWSKEQDKAFEVALGKYWEDDDASEEKWEKIACEVQGKDPGDVKEHYESLVDDVVAIDSGVVQLPQYPDDSSCGGGEGGNGNAGGNGHKGGFSYAAMQGGGGGGNKGSGGSKSEQERRKGVPWTEQEHNSRNRNLGLLNRGSERQNVKTTPVQDRGRFQLQGGSQMPMPNIATKALNSLSECNESSELPVLTPPLVVSKKAKTIIFFID